MSGASCRQLLAVTLLTVVCAPRSAAAQTACDRACLQITEADHLIWTNINANSLTNLTTPRPGLLATVPPAKRLPHEVLLPCRSVRERLERLPTLTWPVSLPASLVVCRNVLAAFLAVQSQEGRRASPLP
jgi:hypothetical protein